MKKIILPLAVCFILLSCDSRKSDKVMDDKRTLVTESLKDTTTVEVIDTLYNFGTIAEGEKVSYSFRFKNTGKKPLIIINTTASCGCTIPEKPEKPILPDETGYIKVVFDSKGKSGQISKTITVNSNAFPPFRDLLLEGEVKQ